MLRLLLLCAFVTVGLGLSAQDAAAKPACNPAQCASKSTASTSCQAKTTSVTATSATAPERANAVAEKQAAPVVAQPALFKLTSLTPAPANCQPADCNKICDPSQCAPAKGTSTAAAPAAKTTTLAVKQE
ncbi:hypothetical protein [Lewinella sp. LCG006]|uniref:hypothetical protein n=1 Tax=Lewinella sp. LCG006 TaxID=3231911 RepID=UPI0034614CEF